MIGGARGAVAVASGTSSMAMPAPCHGARLRAKTHPMAGATSRMIRTNGIRMAITEEAFERTGFTGAINWYRNLDRNWETTPELDGACIEVPSLMVTAEWDPVLRPELAEAMRELVPDLEVAM